MRYPRPKIAGKALKNETQSNRATKERLITPTLLCCSVALCFVLTTPFSSLTQALAQEQTEDPPYGYIDQLVSMSFFPSRVFLLLELGPGDIRQYPAEAISSYREPEYSSKRNIFLAAQVPGDLAWNASQVQHVTFFMQGDHNSFAATPIKSWTIEKLRQNSQKTQLLSEETQRTKTQLEVEQTKLAETEDKLVFLRERASQIAGIDEIIVLKMELARLKGFGEEALMEKERLNNLIELGRKLKEPADIDNRRHELLLQLADTAQATALADRLTQRRRDAAYASIQKKIALIKETKDADIESLAKRAAILRIKRKQLEQILNVSSESGTADDF